MARRAVLAAGSDAHLRAREAVASAAAEAAAARRDTVEALTAREDLDRRWAALIRELALPEDALTDWSLAREAVDDLVRADRAAREAADAEAEAADARARTEAFADRVAALLVRCGRPQAEPRSAVAGLHAELLAARDAAAVRDTRARDVAGRRDALHRAAAAVREIRDDLAALVARAGLDDPAALAEAFARTSELAVLAREIAEATADLEAGGVPLEQLAARTAAISPDDLDAALADAGERIASLDAAYETAVDERTRARRVLADMDASARAAERQEAVSARLAELTDQTEEYVRLHLARTILVDCMERYRREHQNVVLTRARDVFAALTGGRFDRLTASTRPDGGVVLLAGRAGGGDVEIPELSEGTRDQLYLALRLATIERHAQDGRSMPLVLDDIAMTFDDGRTRALLRVLDETSQRFQVLLFTHHDHVGALAMDELPPGRAHLHRLPVYEPAAVPGNVPGPRRTPAVAD